MSHSVVVLALATGLLAGCSPSADETVTHPDGWFHARFAADARMERESEQVLWRTGTLRLAVQSFEPRDEDGGRLSTVADALQRRYELGEVDGVLAQHPCELGGRPARCVRGHIVDGDERVFRDGYLARHADRVCLIEILGPDEVRVGERARALGESLEWQG
jgi:hypothetical protein